MADKKAKSTTPQNPGKDAGVDLTSNTRNDVTEDNGKLLSPVHGATNPVLRGEAGAGGQQLVRQEVGDFEARTIGQPRPWEAYQNEMVSAIDKANDEFRKVQGNSDKDVVTDAAQNSQDPANAGNDGKGSNSETPLLGEEQQEDNPSGGAVVSQHVEDARKGIDTAFPQNDTREAKNGSRN